MLEHMHIEQPSPSKPDHDTAGLVAYMAAEFVNLPYFGGRISSPLLSYGGVDWAEQSRFTEG
jgi:hypothetical protein